MTESRKRSGAWTGERLRAPFCYEAARSALLDAHPGSWQLLAISNTGAFEEVLEVGTGKDALLDAQGRAGQWVFEFVSADGQPVREGERVGTSYLYGRAIVTFRGEVVVPRDVRDVVLTSQITPLSDEKGLVDDVERAHMVARGHLDVPIDLASVVMVRGVNTNWHYRFYAGGEVALRLTLRGPQLELVDKRVS